MEGVAFILTMPVVFPFAPKEEGPPCVHYAVYCGRIRGIYRSHEECLEQVRGFAEGKYQVCASMRDAKLFLGRKNGIDWSAHREAPHHRQEHWFLGNDSNSRSQRQLWMYDNGIREDADGLSYYLF